MDYLWSDLVGNIGVFFILLSYVLLQMEKLRSTQLIYSALNATGAVFVLVSLAYSFNLSSFIIEIFWLAISIFGLLKATKNLPKSK
ncbi:MAG: hypothetical protein ACJA2Q_002114 [Pseudohongiellaceae bacterium]|jgi:hypothetical protein